MFRPHCCCNMYVYFLSKMCNAPPHATLEKEGKNLQQKREIERERMIENEEKRKRVKRNNPRRHDAYQNMRG